MSVTITTAKCDYCSATFERKSTKKKYCSDSCRQAAYRRRADPDIGSPEREARRLAAWEAKLLQRERINLRRSYEWWVADLLGVGSGSERPKGGISKRVGNQPRGPDFAAMIDGRNRTRLVDDDIAAAAEAVTASGRKVAREYMSILRKYGMHEAQTYLEQLPNFFSGTVTAPVKGNTPRPLSAGQAKTNRRIADVERRYRSDLAKSVDAAHTVIDQLAGDEKLAALVALHHAFSPTTIDPDPQETT